jgi:hypothetical protein
VGFTHLGDEAALVASEKTDEKKACEHKSEIKRKKKNQGKK